MRKILRCSDSNSDDDGNIKKREEFVAYGNHNLIDSDEGDEEYDYQKQEVDDMGNFIENI